MKDHIDLHVESEITKCTIGFDIWGTLLDLNKLLESIAHRLARVLNTDHGFIVQRIKWIHEKAREMRLHTPEIPAQRLLDFTRNLSIDILKIDASEIDLAVEKTIESTGEEIVFNDVKSTLEYFKNRGVEMGIIGNTLLWPSRYTRYLLEKTGLMNYFNIVLFSDEIGVFKPDRKIFLIFTERAKTDPSRIMYVGDSVAEDIGGVLSIGGRGILIRRGISRSLVVKELNVAIIPSLMELINIYRILCND